MKTIRNAYKSSQGAELTLNAAILREANSQDSPEKIRRKARVRPFLLNFLERLHVMAEVAGLSISVQQSQVPRDTADESHSAGVGGRRCTLKWYAIRRWIAFRVVYEHHYGHEQIGEPLTRDDVNFNWGRSEVAFQSPS
jgi:hypothetical protein